MQYSERVLAERTYAGSSSSLVRHLGKIALATFVVVGSGCASGGNGLQPEALGPIIVDAPLTAYGYVIYPDSTPAVGAEVWTSPESLLLQVDSTGMFEIERGLEPGLYEFKADLEGDVGTTLILLDYGDYRPIYILLGVETVMPMIDLEDRKALPRRKKGRSRSGGNLWMPPLP